MMATGKENDMSENNNEEIELTSNTDSSNLSDSEKTLLEMVKKSVSDEYSQETEYDQIRAEMSRVREEKLKPDIDDYIDAVVFLEDGTPVFVPEIGDRVIIERPSLLVKNCNWLDTKTYIVRDINHETGTLSLWDPELCQWASSNFITGIKRGLKFKLFPVKGLKKSRKKSKIDRLIEKEEKETQPKKKRGRPAGSKNRDKEVIEQEKLIKLQEKKEKLAKKELRRHKKYVIDHVINKVPTIPAKEIKAEKKKNKTKTSTVKTKKTRKPRK